MKEGRRWKRRCVCVGVGGWGEGAAAVITTVTGSRWRRLTVNNARKQRRVEGASRRTD